MSLALLPPRTAPTMLSSSPAKRDAKRLLAPQQRLLRGLTTISRASSSPSPDSSSSPDREPLSPSSSSPVDFRPVFALSPPRGQPTLQDAQDAIETCDALARGQGRDSCFASFGIDSERIDEFYGPVSRLEAALSSHAGVGLSSFGDETEDEEGEEEEEEEEEIDDDDEGGFRWPSLPGMPRW